MRTPKGKRRQKGDKISWRGGSAHGVQDWKRFRAPKQFMYLAEDSPSSGGSRKGPVKKGRRRKGNKIHECKREVTPEIKKNVAETRQGEGKRKKKRSSAQRKREKGTAVRFWKKRVRRTIFGKYRCGGLLLSEMKRYPRRRQKTAA